MMTFPLLVVCVTCFLCLSEGSAVRRDDNITIDMNCDPTLTSRFKDCPSGYCCVRDEFLPTYVYCKKMGLHEEHCTTKETESACPCGSELKCVPNIQGGAFQSLYGECKPRDGDVVG